jgi:hypothetical protein
VKLVNFSSYAFTDVRSLLICIQGMQSDGTYTNGCSYHAFTILAINEVVVAAVVSKHTEIAVSVHHGCS